MVNVPGYNIRTHDLTTAGREVIDGPYELIAFLSAVDASGAVKPQAKIEVKAERVGKSFPMWPGDRFLNKATKRYVIEWDAQPGITATIGLSLEPNTTDWEPKPTAIVISNIFGGALSSEPDVTCAPGATTQLLAADGTRKTAIIANPSSNPREIRIGDSGAAAGEGLELGPGDRIELPVSGAIYAYNPHSADMNITVVEVTE